MWHFPHPFAQHDLHRGEVRHGHDQVQRHRGTPQASFLAGLETGAVTAGIEGEERPWTWVLDKLDTCEDEVPDRACDFIGVERGVSYGRAIKQLWNGMAFDAEFLPRLLDNPSLSPQDRFVVEHKLDWVYRATGWKRRAPRNG